MRGHALLDQWLDKVHMKYNDLILIVSSSLRNVHFENLNDNHWSRLAQLGFLIDILSSQAQPISNVTSNV